MPTSIRIGCLFLIAATASLWGQTPAPVVTAAQTGVTGTWLTSGEIGPWRLELRADGTRLTGTVSGPVPFSVELFDGRIEGNAVVFRVRVPAGCGGNGAQCDRIITFTGNVNATAIAFRRDVEVRQGAAPGTIGIFAAGAVRQFTARRPNALVTFERVLHADQEPQNWLTYSGTVFGQRHSQLTQITPTNVKTLELAWIWQGLQFAWAPSDLGLAEQKFEATPLVVDGVLYTVQPPNDVIALDATTGRVRWTYRHNTALPGAYVCCGRVNRGLAILGDTLFMGTLDAHLLAISASTGQLVWNTTVADAADPACQRPGLDQDVCYVITHAPLVVKDKVIVGTAGGDGPTRGFVAAFEVTTGKELWRFYTIPAGGEPGNETWSGDSWKTGGAGVWNTGTYDPDLNLTYWGTGNPFPWNGTTRLGDNLYSASVVALDADTGKLKWYYQFTPHDDRDWDAAHIPVLADMEWQGQPRKAMLFAALNENS